MEDSYLKNKAEDIASELGESLKQARVAEVEIIRGSFYC